MDKKDEIKEVLMKFSDLLNEKFGQKQTPGEPSENPIHKTKDGFIKTNQGITISLLKPELANIDILDIANALSKICRFGGNINEFYSVAQHSVLVTHLAPKDLKKAALLHDAAEAYLGDVVKPLKHIISDLYTPIEQQFEAVIFERFNVPIDQLEQIKQYDKLALEYEADYLRNHNVINSDFQKQMNSILDLDFSYYKIHATNSCILSHQYSRQIFLHYFNSLFK